MLQQQQEREQEQEQEGEENDEQDKHLDHLQYQHNEAELFRKYTVSTTIWLSGKKQRPTLYLPEKLRKKYNMHLPCRISIIDYQGEGILLRFLHPHR